MVLGVPLVISYQQEVLSFLPLVANYIFMLYHQELLSSSPLFTSWLPHQVLVLYQLGELLSISCLSHQVFLLAAAAVVGFVSVKLSCFVNQFACQGHVRKRALLLLIIMLLLLLSNKAKSTHLHVHVVRTFNS